jgi:hypothetical protein
MLAYDGFQDVNFPQGLFVQLSQDALLGVAWLGEESVDKIPVLPPPGLGALAPGTSFMSSHSDSAHTGSSRSQEVCGMLALAGKAIPAALCKAMRRWK